MLNDLCIVPMLCLSSANKVTLLVVRDGHQKDPNKDDGQSWGLELMKWYSAIEEIFSSILKSCNVCPSITVLYRLYPPSVSKVYNYILHC